MNYGVKVMVSDIPANLEVSFRLRIILSWESG